MPYPTRTHASTSTTRRNRNENWTMCWSMTDGLFGLEGGFQLLGEQALRAGHHHIVVGGYSLSNEPAAGHRSVQGNLRASKGISAAVHDVDPAFPFCPYRRLIGNKNSGYVFPRQLQIARGC